MRVGLDKLPLLPSLVKRLRSERVGLLAHPASVNAELQHISEVLGSLQIVPKLIFGPEHGYGGEAQDMIGVADARDERSQAPIISLYGDKFEELSPRASQLAQLDILLIDLADVGSRYYTFVWTALLALRAAAHEGICTIVLDRPNPISGRFASTEGACQKDGFLSFVGLEAIPIRHALSVGEILAEFAEREKLSIGPGCALEVVATDGYKREWLASEWDRDFVPPSPNMPTLQTALVYPGGCLLEGTNLSEGRGTTRPFEVFGAPWLNGFALCRELASLALPGFVARPLCFQPTFHKHAGKTCGGIQLHVTDPTSFRPVAAYLAAISLAKKLAPEEFHFRTEAYEFVDNIPAFDLLTGSSQARMAINDGADPKEVIELVCPVDRDYGDVHARAVHRVAKLVME